MISRIAAKRYAESFFDFCKGTLGTQQLLTELSAILKITTENAELRAILRNPEIPAQRKIAVIEKILAQGFSKKVREFIQLLIEKRRFADFSAIVEHVHTLSLRAHNMEAAVLKTPTALSEKTVSSIREKLEKKFNKKLELEVRLDKSLIGGVQVFIGHTIIDGSIKRRLQDLREKLTAVSV